MTTIAYKDGIMAADSQGNWNGDVSYHYNKLARTHNYLIGLTGSFAMWIPLYEWIMARDIAGDDPLYFWKNRPDIQGGNKDGMAIIANRFGKVFAVYPDGGTAPLPGKYESVGSGSRFALGAMHAGASAVQAVEAAIKHDDGTGGSVHRITFGKDPVPPFYS